MFLGGVGRGCVDDGAERRRVGRATAAAPRRPCRAAGGVPCAPSRLPGRPPRRPVQPAAARRHRLIRQGPPKRRPVQTAQRNRRPRSVCHSSVCREAATSADAFPFLYLSVCAILLYLV